MLEMPVASISLPRSMTLKTARFLNEGEVTSWRLASGAALVCAVMALWISPEFSLINLGISLTAGVLSLLISVKMPRGLLAGWIVLLTGLWLSPIANLSSDAQRLVFAASVLVFSAVYQGYLTLYFATLLFGIGFCANELGRDLGGFAHWLQSDSVLALHGGLIFGVSLFFARVAHTRAENFYHGLRQTSSDIEKTRARMAAMQESLLGVRERMLGQTLSEGESLLGNAGTSDLRDSQSPMTAAFGEIVATLRNTFADFQVRGRAEGRIVGPVRFVFFAPAAGYDEKSIIAVDLKELARGVDACLSLALESLPEIGARKREGVIRMSLRYGLRVVEVAVEDNGRGLASRNLQAEDDLGILKELVSGWGGKFDRLARLGVGSRTSLELRIVHERAKAYRATLRHQVPLPVEILSGPSPS